MKAACHQLYLVHVASQTLQNPLCEMSGSKNMDEIKWPIIAKVGMPVA